jgi:uncharacterized protein YcgL (UPF0745 family)
MQCYVYRGDKKEDHYLFLAQEFDQENLPSNFPVAILGLMGELSFVVEFDLDAERKLPQADARHVLADIEANGYYLQMPKKDMAALEDEFFN